MADWNWSTKKFLAPVGIAILGIILFSKSFPAEGECAINILVAFPTAIFLAFLCGIFLQIVKKTTRALLISTAIILLPLLFLYPVTCEASPASSITRMVKILFNKSSVNYTDFLNYDFEKKTAALKKIRKNLSPDKIYIVDVIQTNDGEYGSQTFIYIKNNEIFTVDTILFQKPESNELSTYFGGNTIKIYTKGNYIDTEQMGISQRSFVANSDFESYTKDYDNHTKIVIKYYSPEDEDHKARLNYWAFRLFYRLY